MPIDVMHRRFRSSDELDQLPYSKTAAHRAVRTTIGQELKERYEVPQDLPLHSSTEANCPIVGMSNAVIVFKKQRKEHVARMQGIGNNVPMTHDQG